jgi:hypothetical protein
VPSPTVVLATATAGACGLAVMAAVGPWTRAAFCERDQRRDLIQMERLLDGVQPQAVVRRLHVQCTSGGDALLVAAAPRWLPRRQVTRAFVEAGWRAGHGGWQLESPDGGYVVTLVLDASRAGGHEPVGLELRQSGYRAPLGD